MNSDAILDGVKAILARQFGVKPEAITRETVAMDVDGWDSVSHVYVMLEIEQHFAVKIPDEQVFSMDNVGELVDLLAGLPKGR